MKRIVAVLLLACVHVALPQDEASVGGKPLAELMKQLQSGNRGLQLRAAQALSEAPADLQPRIVPRMTELLKSERENDRFVAAQVLGNFGPAARGAVPGLVPLLQGTQYERNRAASAKALGQILQDAAPGEEVEGVTAALVTAWGDKYEDVRREAVFALGMIGPAAKSCIPRLDERLRDVQPVRNAAAWTCGRMGKLAACHVDRLIAIMHGERYPQVDPFFTAAVQDAIGLIGPVHGNVVPNLVDRMEAIAAGTAFHPQHNGAMGRICYLRSVAALERMGPASASATSYLKRVIGGNPFGDREKTLAMVKALGAIGPGAAEAAPELRRIADAKPPVKPDAGFDELRQAAIAALGAVSPAAGAAAGATK